MKGRDMAESMICTGAPDIERLGVDLRILVGLSKWR